MNLEEGPHTICCASVAFVSPPSDWQLKDGCVSGSKRNGRPLVFGVLSPSKATVLSSGWK